MPWIVPFIIPILVSAVVAGVSYAITSPLSENPRTPELADAPVFSIDDSKEMAP